MIDPVYLVRSICCSISFFSTNKEVSALNRCVILCQNIHVIAIKKSFFFHRHAIAAIHFNYNLHREVKQLEDGTQQMSVKYPKFMNGQASVRDVRVVQNFGMFKC